MDCLSVSWCGSSGVNRVPEDGAQHACVEFQRAELGAKGAAALLMPQAGVSNLCNASSHHARLAACVFWGGFNSAARDAHAVFEFQRLD